MMITLPESASIPERGLRNRGASNSIQHQNKGVGLEAVHTLSISSVSSFSESGRSDPSGVAAVPGAGVPCAVSEVSFLEPAQTNSDPKKKSLQENPSQSTHLSPQTS